MCVAAEGKGYVRVRVCVCGWVGGCARAACVVASLHHEIGEPPRSRQHTYRAAALREHRPAALRGRGARLGERHRARCRERQQRARSDSDRRRSESKEEEEEGFYEPRPVSWRPLRDERYHTYGRRCGAIARRAIQALPAPTRRCAARRTRSGLRSCTNHTCVETQPPPRSRGFVSPSATPVGWAIELRQNEAEDCP